MLYLQHLSIPAYTMVSLMKSLLVKGFGIVNDRTSTDHDTYLLLELQSCRLQLEPFLVTMAPKTVGLVMQTLHKSTLDEAFTIRQNVESDAVVVSRNLLPGSATSENEEDSGQTQPKQ